MIVVMAQVVGGSALSLSTNGVNIAYQTQLTTLSVVAKQTKNVRFLLDTNARRLWNSHQQGELVTQVVCIIAYYSTRGYPAQGKLDRSSRVGLRPIPSPP